MIRRIINFIKIFDNVVTIKIGTDLDFNCSMFFKI